MNRETECALVRDLLPGHLDGVTAPETNAFIDEHLTVCESCRAARRAMLNIVTPAEQAQSELLEGLRRAHKRRKKRAWLIGIALVLIACICFLPLPLPVHQAVQAVVWQGGTEDYRTVPVRMEGLYMSYLFRADCYRGLIEIEGILPAQERELYWYNEDQALLTSVDEEGMLHIAGFIVAAPGMSEFMIGLYGEDGGWDGRDGLNITGPAATREEAVARTQEICWKYSPWLSSAQWEGGLR